MPGRVLALTRDLARGVASHPRLPAYRVLVHVARGSRIVASAMTDDAPTLGGFTIHLETIGAGPSSDLAGLRLRIGETDEWLDGPPAVGRTVAGLLTVEDILSDAHRPRAWVSGATCLDAEAAGLSADTIIDLLHRDYLGRSCEPLERARLADLLGSGPDRYDAIRRHLLASPDYWRRAPSLDRAPGSIFSQGIVMAAARRAVSAG